MHVYNKYSSESSLGVWTILTKVATTVQWLAIHGTLTDHKRAVATLMETDLTRAGHLLAQTRVTRTIIPSTRSRTVSMATHMPMINVLSTHRGTTHTRTVLPLVATTMTAADTRMIATMLDRTIAMEMIAMTTVASPIGIIKAKVLPTDTQKCPPRNLHTGLRTIDMVTIAMVTSRTGRSSESRHQTIGTGNLQW